MEDSTTNTHRAETEGRADIYRRITNQIAAAIEAGAGEWQMPWHPGADGAMPVLPVNAVTGKPYRGVNIVERAILTAAAKAQAAADWMHAQQNAAVAPEAAGQAQAA